jgi:hypothetical protein
MELYPFSTSLVFDVYFQALSCLFDVCLSSVRCALRLPGYICTMCTHVLRMVFFSPPVWWVWYTRGYDMAWGDNGAET